METTSGYADVNGTRLYYEVAGSGLPLVLVHGFSLDTRMWDEQFERFAEHYRVVRYDVRGYGKSLPPTGEGYYHADDLKALLDHLEIATAYIAGLSLGGAIALEFAVAHPESVRGFILVDSILWGYSWSDEGNDSMGDLWSAALTSGAEGAKTLWLQHPFFAPAHEIPEVSTNLRRMVSDYSGWHWLNSDPGIVPMPPALFRLDSVSAPTLIIIGERDVQDLQNMSELLHTQIPNARKVVIPGAGHMSNMENPVLFNQIVLDFLSGL
jgi:pimeloyl-ACP methyl ester carboxylesterase